MGLGFRGLGDLSVFRGLGEGYMGLGGFWGL